PASHAALALLRAHLSLLVEALALRGGGRPGRAAALRDDEGGAHERGEPFARQLEVLPLGARLVGGDDDAPRAVEPRSREALEPRHDRGGEDGAPRGIEAELDFRRDFVDVLAPGA